MATEPLTGGQPSTDAFAGKLVRTEIQRGPSSIPGREIVQVLTEIPVGVESGWHTHPGEEVGYILAGTVEMRIDGKPSLILHAGDGFLIPPATPHDAVDVGPGTGRMLSTYVVEVGEPLVALAGGGSRPGTGPRARTGAGPMNTYRLHLHTDQLHSEQEVHATEVEKEDGWTIFRAGDVVFMRIRDEHIVSLEHLI